MGHFFLKIQLRNQISWAVKLQTPSGCQLDRHMSAQAPCVQALMADPVGHLCPPRATWPLVTDTCLQAAAGEELCLVWIDKKETHIHVIPGDPEVTSKYPALIQLLYLFIYFFTPWLLAF